MKVLSSRAILIFKVFREKELQVAIGSNESPKKIRVVKNTAIVIVLIILWIIISQNQSCVLKCNVRFFYLFTGNIFWKYWNFIIIHKYSKVCKTAWKVQKCFFSLQALHKKEAILINTYTSPSPCPNILNLPAWSNILCFKIYWEYDVTYTTFWLMYRSCLILFVDN